MVLSAVRPAWEYTVVPLETSRWWHETVDPGMDRLTKLGQEGWEAVGISLSSGDLVAKPVVLLKRQLP
jgi:hypothetical protein